MQVLDLIFVKEDGKTVVFSIDNPITPVNETVVNQCNGYHSFSHLYFHQLVKIPVR